MGSPTEIALDLVPPGPYTIGRRTTHAVCLGGEDLVSRDHAAILHRSDREGGTWFLVDTFSKHGTRLNGSTVPGGQEYPLRPGDLIDIAPWTFRVIDPESETQRTSRVATIDEDTHGAPSMETIDVGLSREMARERLSLMLRCAESIHKSTDLRMLAETIAEAALSGTGFQNIAVLSPLDKSDDVEVIAYRGAILGRNATLSISRSLLVKAAEGQPVRVAEASDFIVTGASIADLGILQALCVPLMLGKTVAGFLYLDNRLDQSRPVRVPPDAAEFAAGLGRLAALAMANLMRRDLELRHARVQADLEAAAEAQRWVFPSRQGVFGRLSYVGESRPGQLLGGDFFDVIQLDGHRVAVAVADVSGKGIPASVLMTETQGFLHAALLQGDPGRAVTELNRFVHPRRPANRFVTLWVGVFDTNANTVTYVNAGHGNAIMALPDRTFRALDTGGGWPVGVALDTIYTAETTRLEPGGRAVIVSDGVTDQRNPAATDQSSFFGMSGVRRSLIDSQGQPDQIAALFTGLIGHAGSQRLADDATAIIVWWD
ncbi:MAG: SpoIIE family protein phosphatase [Phycisphaerales bacterium]|nr:SpoIIE family protein phosphatase [Phycisphaerales bacterium]